MKIDKDKKLQDKLMKPRKRDTKKYGQIEKDKREKRRKAVSKMRDTVMEDTIKSLAKRAVASEQLGDDKETERLTSKIEKLKKQLAREQKDTAFKK